MSLLGKDNFFIGSFSMAGRDSAEKYNIVAEANKVEEKEKNRIFKYFFSPDLEWENENEDIDNESIEKECNLNIEHIKKNIKFSLDYLKQKKNNQSPKKADNLKTNIKKNPKKKKELKP